MGKQAQANMEISITVRGELSSKAGVKILKGGEAIGLVSGKIVEVEGTIKGKVLADEKVVIAKGGLVEGEIDSAALCVEKGAYYRGRCRIGLQNELVENTVLESPKVTLPEKSVTKRWFWQS